MFPVCSEWWKYPRYGTVKPLIFLLLLDFVCGGVCVCMCHSMYIQVRGGRLAGEFFWDSSISVGTQDQR